MPDPHLTPRRLRIRDLAVAIALMVWVVVVARTEHRTSLTPPVVPYASAAR